MPKEKRLPRYTAKAARQTGALPEGAAVPARALL